MQAFLIFCPFCLNENVEMEENLFYYGEEGIKGNYRVLRENSKSSQIFTFSLGKKLRDNI